MNENHNLDYPPLIPGTDSSMLNALRAHNSCETQESDIEISRIIRTKRYKTDCNNDVTTSTKDTVTSNQSFTHAEFGQSFRNKIHQDSVFKQVIIIEPIASIDPESSNKEVEKFFSNDLFLAREISKSILGECSIEKTSKNFKKKIVIVHLLRVNKERLVKLG